MSTDSERDEATDRLLKAVLRPTSAQTGPACLDGEKLAAWADGVIYGQEATDIEAHLADCARCQAMAAAFARAEPVEAAPIPLEAPNAPAAPLPFRPRQAPRWFIPAAIGAAAAMLLIWTAVRRPAEVAAPAASVARVEPTASSVPVPAAESMAQLRPMTPTPQAGVTATAAAAKPAAMAPQAAGQIATSPATAPPAVASPAASPVITQAPPSRPVVLPAAPPQAVAAGAAARVITGADMVRTDTPTMSQAANALVAKPLPAASPTPYFMALPGGGVEFGPPPPEPAVSITSFVQTSRGTGKAAGAAESMASGAVRWRVLAMGKVLRSLNNGTTWDAVAIDPATIITSGAAPSSTVCWLIGRGGVVLRSVDGVTFTRVPLPETADALAITATDDRQATVTTTDGRTFRTNDGGLTWRRGGF